MKLINQVFDLNLSEEKNKYYDNLYVQRIERDKDFRKLSIHFLAKKYYSYNDIYYLIDKIRKIYFNKKRIDIIYNLKYDNIDEDFISNFNKYKNDLYNELKTSNVVFANMLFDSNISLEKNENSFIANINIPKYIIYEENYNDFTKYIKKYFEFRYGINLDISVSFIENDYKTNIDDEINITEEIKKNIDDSHMKNFSSTHVQTQNSDNKPHFPKREVNRTKLKYFADGKVIFGKEIKESEKLITIDQIKGEIDELVINCEITFFECKITSTNKRLVNLILTDRTDSIYLSLWPQSEEDYLIMSERLAEGKFIKIKASAWEDKFKKEIMVKNVLSIEEITKEDIYPKRVDTENEKRVELHLHTKMSAQDGIGEIEDYIDTAVSFGMKALAITDHGVCHSFAKARHYLQSKSKKDDNYKNFKLIYGVEGYLVNDLNLDIPSDGLNYNINDEYVVFDIETTGLNKYKNDIIEIGAVLIKNGEIISRFSEFINPNTHIPERITELTSITDNDVKNADTINVVLPKFKDFVKDRTLVGHNVNFDYSFIVSKGKLLNIDFSNNKTIDTMFMQRYLLPNLKNSKLDTLAKELKVVNEHHHRAIDDAVCTAKCFIKLIEYNNANKQNVNTDEIYSSFIKKLPTHHIIILAKNDVGRVNLYKLISASHINYFYKKPRIPKSLINKFREGLIIGSACSEGELYKSILDCDDYEVSKNIASFYDYIEVQPLSNNKYLIDDEKSYVSSNEDLIDINLKLIKIANELNLPCIATSDCHFVNKEDVLYRNMLMSFLHNDNVQIKEKEEENKNAINALETNNNSDTNIDSVDLSFKSTSEMLQCFNYLKEDDRRKIVIENTNLIADMIENISPVRGDKCPPHLENCENELRDFCYNNLKNVYGENPPAIVKERLEKELNSIISNGYSVMYMAAKKTIDESNRNGYSVGSRGSVGSSFVATMCGISEVNPLPPHYICPNCKYADFDSDVVQEYKTETGYDLPDKTCPNCGHKLNKDGANIPFETFLGFEGNKEPDIDLNFSDEFQNDAHRFTNVLFGENNTFKAGTISTIADKQAKGIVRDYFELKNVHKSRAHIEYLAKRLQGIKKTTGQHPGGIIVLPEDEDIYTFTPIQYPANKMFDNNGLKNKYTTHFEYHDIDENLLKLDMLGHGGPTMIRKLYDLTGIDPITVDFTDKKILELFKSLNSLNISTDAIGGLKLGLLTVPEFGTNVAMNMVMEAKPESISDLIRISGLAHGTGVWQNNARNLIQDKVVVLRDAICCRDDIMIYLMNKGIEAPLAFDIMERVRKGKHLTKSDEEVMLSHDVPEWYIKSCNTIEYMFPKAHATAYVMSALRIAYFKVYYPVAFYTAYFTVNVEDFDYNVLCMNPANINIKINELNSQQDKLDAKTLDLLYMLNVVREMQARGIEWTDININTAKAKNFIIVDNKIMPSFMAIPGIGEDLSKKIEEIRSDKPFENIEDFKERTGISSKNFEKLDSINAFNGLKHKEVDVQKSLLDFI